jgi:hypothetical protein
VRSRARAALTELAGADPDRNVGLTDYLLGQADPIGRADAVRHLRDEPDDHRLAAELTETLREMYPNAELPRLPGEPRPPRRPGAQGESGPRGLASSLSQRQTRIVVGAGAAAVLLIVIVLAITGAFSGDDEPSGSASTETTTAPADEQAVPVEFRPVGGSDAGGVAVFGFATADQPFIELQLRDLQPANNDDAYVLWFLTGEDEGFPLPSPLEVDNQGNLSDRIAVPAEVIGIATQSQTITIALNNRNELNREIDRALEEEQGTLSYPGGTVLSARIARGQAQQQG